MSFPKATSELGVLNNVNSQICLPTLLKMNRSIDRFHLTSRRPYWCTKTMKWRPYWCTVRKPENKRPVTDIVRYEKVIVWHNWVFAGQFVRQHINTTIGETVYNWH